MIFSQIESFTNPTNIPCEHDTCDGRAARWIFPQTKHQKHGVIRSCSVHLARFVEATIGLDLVTSNGVQITEFSNPQKRKCTHPKCDGRAAYWTFPQTVYLPTGAFISCGVHLPRFADIVLRYHVIPTTNGRKQK